MDDRTVGLVLRALRRRRGWAQAALAGKAGVSQSLVSRAERGDIAALTLATLRRLFLAVEGRLALEPTWRGAGLERLLDARHARIVGEVARRLEASGWMVMAEVTYSEYGERGSIDLLGLRPARRAALVVEVKTDIPSAEAVGRKTDEKVRLAPTIVSRRLGWQPSVVGRVVVLPATTRLREILDGTPALRRMFPARTVELRRWLRDPSAPISAAWFVRDSTGLTGTSRSRPRGGTAARRTSVRTAVSPVDPGVEGPDESGRY